MLPTSVFLGENTFVPLFSIQTLSFLSLHSRNSQLAKPRRPGISPQLWSIFPRLHMTWDKYAFDMIASLAVPIDNYISRGTDVFVEGRAPDGRR